MTNPIRNFISRKKDSFIRERRSQDAIERYGGAVFGLIVLAAVIFTPGKYRQQAAQYLFLLAAVFVAVTIYRIKLTRRQLREKNVEIEKQKSVIESHQKEIIDSINYAKRIQDGILPSAAVLNACLPEGFSLYKPKAIVAGDFYWMEKAGDVVFIAAADCTGHGVPGAMVSIVCHNALNRAVNEFHLTDTGKILDKVTDLVMETFEKSGNEVNDGMDISLLSVNRVKKEIQWSGANNPLVYFENGELKEISADKQPVGRSIHRKSFTSHAISYKEGNSFYLFTDGYADQFGGPKGKKFKHKQLLETISAVAGKPVDEQKKIFNEVFEKWKGDLEQTDDVCLIGMKL